MSSAIMRTACLFAFVALGASELALAQFKPIPPPMPTFHPPPPMPMPPLTVITPTPVTPIPSFPTPSLPAPRPAPDLNTTAIAPTGPAPPAVAPGCPGQPGCPPASEGKGPLGELAEELLKEFAKCEAEKKPIETCLSDDPPPFQLRQLSTEGLSRLTQCLGSSNLSATRDRWNGCVAEVQ